MPFALRYLRQERYIDLTMNPLTRPRPSVWVLVRSYIERLFDIADGRYLP